MNLLSHKHQYNYASCNCLWFSSLLKGKVHSIIIAINCEDLTWHNYVRICRISYQLIVQLMSNVLFICSTLKKSKEIMSNSSAVAGISIMNYQIQDRPFKMTFTTIASGYRKVCQMSAFVTFHTKMPCLRLKMPFFLISRKLFELQF